MNFKQRIANSIKNHDNGHMKGFKSDSSGRLRIGLLLFLTLIGACIYLGFQLAPYWINKSEMEDFLAERARTSELASDEEIQAAIIGKADQLGITLTNRDIEIDRSPRVMSISITWQFEYNFFGLYTHTFTFSPQATINHQ
jgi:hypothetical protein